MKKINLIIGFCFSLLFNQTFSEFNSHQLTLFQNPLNFKIETNKSFDNFDMSLIKKQDTKKGIRWMMLGSALQLVGGLLMITNSDYFHDSDYHYHYDDWGTYTSASGSHSHIVIGMPIIAAGSLINLYGLSKIYKSLKD